MLEAQREREGERERERERERDFCAEKLLLRMIALK